jgi:hypothetical protein
VGGTSESVGTAQIRPPAGGRALWHAPDERRVLQLVLATIWLFDGVLQLQPFMFTRQFGTDMLAPVAHGNPTPVSHSVLWASRIISDHSVGTDAAFAAFQILLALGIAWRPTVKVALAASIGWACLVWWFGEGLGGVLTTASSTVGGAPGAVVLYGVIAVLLWPVDRAGPDPSCIAARAVGEGAARVIWTVLWGALALFAVLGANRSADGLGQLVRSLGAGEPSWLATLDRHAANALGHNGLAVSIALAVVLGVIALGASLPWRLARIVTVLAVAVALVLWVLGQNFGEIFSGSATDPNTGPLLALVAAAYWRRKPGVEPPAAPGQDLVMQAPLSTKTT